MFFTQKKEYGIIPRYLEKIQKEMKDEVEYIEMIKEAELKSKETTRKLSEEEI